MVLVKCKAVFDNLGKRPGADQMLLTDFYITAWFSAPFLLYFSNISEFIIDGNGLAADSWILIGFEFFLSPVKQRNSDVPFKQLYF